MQSHTKENEESFEILSEIIFFQNEIFKMTKSWVIMNILYVAKTRVEGLKKWTYDVSELLDNCPTASFLAGMVNIL
jgi:hypothetical protein